MPRLGIGISGTNITTVGPGLGVSVGGGGGFVGPYDSIPSITALYAMRRGLTSYTGPIVRLRRDSDNAESDFGAVSNGDLDTAAIATFVGAGSGYIVTWYDQSGNGYDATQATAASQPLYVASGLSFDGSDDYLATGLVQLAGMGLLVRVSGGTNPGFAAGAGQLLVAPNRAGRRYTDGSNATVQPGVNAGVLGVGNGKGYYNGAVDVTGMTGAVDSADDFYLGAANTAGTPTAPGAMTLHEVAIFATAPLDAGFAAASTIMETA